MIVAIIGGILLFGQTVGNWGYYSIGIGIGVMGIMLLSRYQAEMTGTPAIKEIPKVDQETNETPKAPQVFP